jgi:D-cysteine desulfhydrase family pyridoxal phosphate-dependent enzyme
MNSAIMERLLPRPLGCYPTPLQRLENLERLYPGYRLLIKRDDLSGLALGGNKVRKLEHLMAEALAQGADTVITAGALQSNHCRQTAAACAVLGLECHLWLGGVRPEQDSGNLLLDRLLGARLHFAGEDRTGQGLPELRQRLEAEGRRCHLIPYGGSSPLGAMGFVDAARELARQWPRHDEGPAYLFFASSSGGTQAGLMAGLAETSLAIRLMPVRVDKEPLAGQTLQVRVATLANALSTTMDMTQRWPPDQVPLLCDYDMTGYGRTTPEERRAISLLASREGILLDPVYTARAFQAMLDHLERRLLPEGSTVLFWHSGGQPALFT